MSRVGNRVLGSSDLAVVRRSIAVEGAVAKVQVRARGVDDEHQHWQPYGFGSAPKSGAQALRLAPGAQRDDLLVVMVDDRRYRITLAEGEVAIFDDLGQRVHLTRSGIVIDAPDIALGAGAAAGVARAGDAIALDMTPGTSWAAQVTSAINTLASGSVTAPTASGTITSGSSKVRSE